MRGICKLCFQEGDLQNSHLLPKAIYRWIRRIGGSPVAYTKDAIFHTDWQVCAPLLCLSCEDRLNRGGEKWVIENMYRGKAQFPLQEMLKAATPLTEQPLDNAVLYDRHSATSGNADKLVYFGASVFWRAGARKWKLGSNELKDIDLGCPYTEGLRRFLMGQSPFPASVLLNIQVSTTTRHPHLIFPYGGKARDGSCHRYHFFIPGIAFSIFLGKRIPSDITKYRSAIWLSDIVEDEALESANRATSKARPAGKIKEHLTR